MYNKTGTAAGKMPRRPVYREPIALPRRFVRHKTMDPCTVNPPPCRGAPCAAKPRGMRSGRPGAFLAQETAMANNVRRYGLSRLQASRSPFAPASAFRNAL